MRKIITIVALLSLLNSCHSSDGLKSTVRLYQDQLTKGSSLDKITKEYGQYAASWPDESNENNENNNNLYQYSYSKSHYDLVAYLPIINHFGWIKSENYEVLLIFDDQNLLISEKKFYNRAKSRTGLICNPQVYSCLRQVYQ